MAEDLDLDFEDDDLGIDDLGDLGDLDPFAEPPPPANKREAITRTLKSGVKGFTEDIKDDSLKSASEIAEAALPKKLSGETNAVKEVSEKLKDEITKAGREVRAQATSTINAAESILPKNETVGKMANKLKSLFGSEDEIYERKKTAEELNNEEIANKLEEALGSKDKRAEYEDLLNKQIELNRFKSTKEISNIIASNTELLNKFNREVTANYYRRSLEVQYKHLFVARQQLELLASGMDGFKNQFAAIANNTGLPEYVKLKKSEVLATSIKGRMYEGITDKLYADDNAVGRIRKNLINKVTGVKDNVLSSFGMVRDAADAKETGAEMAGMAGGAGGIAGSLLAGWVKTLAGEKLGEHLEKDDKVKARMFKAKNIASDLPGFINDLKPKHEYNENGDETLKSKTKNSALNFIKDIVGKEVDPNKTRLHKEDINDVGIFDNRTKSSINKVIPGLLSKIHAEIKSMRTGNKPEDNELFYDNKSDQFKLKKDISTVIEKKVKSKLSKDTLYYVNRFINDLQEYGGLEINDELEDKQLRKAVISYILNGGSMSPTKLLNKKFLNHFNSRLKGKVTKAVKNTLKEGKKDIDVLESVSTNLKRIKTSLPNIEEDVNELSKTGNLGELEKLGLIKRDKLTGEASFDDDKYKKLLIDQTTKFSNRDVKLATDTKQKEIDELKKKEEEGKSFADKLKEKAGDKIDKFKKEKLNLNKDNIPGSKSFVDLKNRATEATKDAKSSKLYKDAKAKVTEATKDAKSSKLYKVNLEEYNTLKNEFQNSELYKDGVVKTVDDFANSLNIEIPKEIKIKSLKEEAKKIKKEKQSKLKSLFNNRKKITNNAKDKISDIGKVLTSDKTKENIKKTHSLDHKIAGGTIKLAGKAALGIIKSPYTITKGIGKLGSKLLSKKTPKDNASLFDADGDGDRDGNWKDRLALFKKKPKDEKDKVKDRNEKSSGLDFGLLLTIAGGILSVGKRIFGGITSVIKTVTDVGSRLIKPILNIGKSLLKLPLAIGNALFSVLTKGGLIGGAVNVAKKAGSAIAKGAGALWSGAKNLLGFGGEETTKKVVTKTTSSVAKKIGLKGGAKLAGKLASRAIPVLGWGLAAWDAVNIGKKMLMDGKSFKSAVSEQMLGTDITDDAGKPLPTGEKPIKKNTIKTDDDKNVPVKPVPLRGGPLADNTLEHVLPANRKVDISNMNPSFKDNLARMANEYYELTGKNIIINSGYRSRAYQAALRAKYGSKAAKPGHSLHEFGLAFDTDTKTANELDNLGLMRKYGFTRPVGKETWHVESAGIQHAIPKVKKDPNLASNLVANSIGIGGGGWGLLPNVRKYSRNLKYQLNLTKAKPTEPKENDLTKKLAIKPANNLIVKKKKEKFTKLDNRKDLVTKVKHKNLTTTSVGKHDIPDAEKQPDTSYNISRNKHATINNRKLELQASVKPVMDLHRTTLNSNKILNSVDDGIQQSVKIQLRMLEVLTNIEKNMLKDTESDTKYVENKKENVTQERVRTSLPEPTIDLGRRTKFAS